jgi:glucose-1-phosphatase
MEIQKELVKVVVFDLGGVIINISFAKALETWSTYANVSPETLKSRFIFDMFYEQHERGEITGAAYFASLRNSLGINLTDTQLEEGWNAIYMGEVPGIKTLLNQARQHFPLYAFSNTNQTHWTYLTDNSAEVLGLFKKVFVSFEMGERKPDKAAFERVAKETGVNPEQILFFDDLLENVAGARAARMQAVHVRTFADTKEALESLLALR